MNEFLTDFVKESGNEYANIVCDGLDGADVGGFLDTGSYAFNALLSGSLSGGIPNNKIIALAGESATGKTYFALGIVHKFLADNDDGVVLYFDTEQAVTSDMFTDRGVDSSRVAVFPVATIEDFRHQAIKIVDKYLELPQSERKPMLICLDSLGMLSTSKEIVDTADGKGTRDMTRAQMIKSTFRVLTIKLGKAAIPLILTNHTYDVIGSMFPQKEMGGGSGLKYAASTIVYLSKKKVKEGTDVIGNIIHCKLYKSRFTKENSMIDVMLNYDEGLNPYYGLVDIALKYEIFNKVSTRIEVSDGTKVYEKQLYKQPEKYFTADVMKQLEVAVAKEFKYGKLEIEDEPEQPTTKV
jgi:RecA/RadA recombinase|tara:strand:- start:3324 stop:4382 length:1059 start_codon:yes stop_codon:yes gene_type:complete